MLIIDIPMPMHGCEDCPLLSSHMVCRYDGRLRDVEKYINSETRPEWCVIWKEITKEQAMDFDKFLYLLDKFPKNVRKDVCE